MPIAREAGRSTLAHFRSPDLSAETKADGSPVTAAMADRMGDDLTVDHAPAQRDFGYAPRAFAYPDGEPAAGLPRR